MVNFLKESSLSPLRIMLFLRLAENRLVLREMREPGGTGPVRQREMNRTNPFNHKELEYLLDFYKSTNSRPGCSATAFIVNATGRVKEWGRPGQCPTSRWGRLLSPVREAETEKNTWDATNTHRKPLYKQHSYKPNVCSPPAFNTCTECSLWWCRSCSSLGLCRIPRWRWGWAPSWGCRSQRSRT